MEVINIEKDIPLFYITASSFPEGIMPAHEKLQALVPVSTERRYFGLSRPEGDGPIVYRAAAEELAPGEAEQLGLDKLILKKGRYISSTLKDYASDITSVDKTFGELLSYPDLDPEGYCVELYVNEKDMVCMVRLDK